MPDNVKVWTHFYCQDDSLMKVGSFFMQSEGFMHEDDRLYHPIGLLAFVGVIYQWFNNLYTQRLEDVYKCVKKIGCQ